MAVTAAPLATPTPNTGAHAQGMLLVAQGLESLKKAIALLDPMTPLGPAVARALEQIGKKAGSPPPEAQANSLQAQAMEARRTALQRLAMSQQQQQGASPMGAMPGAAQPVGSTQGSAAPSPLAMAA